MRTYIRKLSLILVLLAGTWSTARAEEWKGISPSVSTRADVVRLFKECEDRTAQCEFQLEGNRIRIVFSGMVQDYFYPCSRELPADTVLLVEVTPAQPIKLKSLKRSRTFKKLGTSSIFSAYFDERAGLILMTKNENIIELNYVADASNRVRCEDYYNNPPKFVAVITHCPPVTLKGPSDAVGAGSIINFKADVEADPKMTLVWTVSGGKIVTQSSRDMFLDTSGLNGQSIRVSVQARGSCSVENSMTLQIRQSPFSN